MIIQISYDETNQAFERVKALVAASKLRDIDFQRIDPVVERGEYTCIADEEGPDAQIVLEAIQDELAGRRESSLTHGFTIFGVAYDL